ncbi:TetR/AcrR family transcriptional regulator [Frondihabitans cladoniiphilus]|uniref:TetR/AcrR family transcriptional regulator n=1 Tax=Frondihabitans cladoniiphilus TaxID=715785 RepID=A0ABP8VNL8_9MICO
MTTQVQGPDTGRSTEHPARSGRRRDPSVDDRVLAAALDLLVDGGFEAMTMEAVASRAGTGKAGIYRRWGTKQVLVVDAVLRSGLGAPLQVGPDSGSLRDDLSAIVGSESAKATDEKTRLLTGLLTVIREDAKLRQVVVDAVIEPRVVGIRTALERARARGEISPSVDLKTLALVLPSMLLYRLLVSHEPVTRAWQYEIVDGIIAWAFGDRPGSGL